jgi:hypothetical protein
VIAEPSVEALLRYWGKHAELRALQRRASASAKRELIERFLVRRGWTFLPRVSFAIDRLVILEEWQA